MIKKEKEKRYNTFHLEIAILEALHFLLFSSLIDDNIIFYIFSLAYHISYRIFDMKDNLLNSFREMRHEPEMETDSKERCGHVVPF